MILHNSIADLHWTHTATSDQLREITDDLAFAFRWHAAPHGIGFDRETLPQASIEQCKMNGAAFKELYPNEIKWKCIKGVGPL